MRPDQVASADSGEHAIEHARIRFLVRDAPARNAVAIAVAVGLEHGRIARAGERRDLVPGGVRGDQQLLGLAGHRNEARYRIAVAGGPALVEDITDRGYRALGPQLRQNVLDAGEAAKALGLEAARRNSRS